MARRRDPSKQDESQNPMAHKQVGIRFGNKREEFGKFCEALAAASIPFTLGGNRTVFIDEKTRAGLSGTPRQLLSEYTLSRDVIASEETVDVADHRIVRSREDAKRIAQRYMQGR